MLFHKYIKDLGLHVVASGGYFRFSDLELSELDVSEKGFFALQLLYCLPYLVETAEYS